MPSSKPPARSRAHLLESIGSPADLRKLEPGELPALADALRDFLIDSVSRTGGHLSSNLGTVELTIALHYVFNTPEDRIVWDVGHQTYAHKVLTGRREAMSSLRQYHGLSGFPKRSESTYDTFGTAHSSTSISAALGMAEAARLRGEDRRAIAVIGDGAMTAGMAFEALNNAGDIHDTNLLVILNDNEMSISPPVGALNKHLSRLLSGRLYNGARQIGKRVLGNLPPPVIELARRTEEHVKGMVMPGTMFEEFGFNYIGPIDGHDLESLLPTLQNLRTLKGPQFLHVITRKGQGYKLAEADPILYHGVSKFDHAAGIATGKDAKGGGKLTYTQVFGDWLCDMAALDKRLVAITPAMREGSGMVRFAHEYPDRYYDVGIAEQHALTFAAGLACEGLKPVVAIYSTFLQRAYDQLIHDIALQNLPVMMAIDRAGLVGADGATHHGAFDLSFLACIPNLVIFCPADEDECRQMLYTAYRHDGPTAVRYPRGSGLGSVPRQAMSELPIGKGEIRRQGKGCALLAFGSMLGTALQVGEELDATVANMRFVKPIDRDLILQLAAGHDLLVTLEENATIGGAGSEVSRVLNEAGSRVRVLQLGLPDRFVDHGDQAQLLAESGLDSASVLDRIKKAYQVNS
ncbi:MAG: 1-deoxy-D-xylulose-5-phosphate synthase [Pseudomonadota bacterium]|jgi:1-deoxy-D-xylulose-5-phosphate synthase|uniref:1-deoxy-D-xylulose-5-phosphate synthase n=1 Tax=Zoogloea ramigera TaxID=350 RepID=A0A4Y4CXI9_ZOORA|nr:1-deoxy-D-xylulose-5-phosphate synthase [Zoogloea ramigera]MBP7625945.1 1-deoxy-D-xylulose-5-phosphate synthase [Zoogloea sp.]GEC96204.1 1-deoxy-D-xylulose-5-phosphate synthase [Zoogloea ramigera]